MNREGEQPAVVYCSQTGFTAKYARWVGEELGVAPVVLTHEQMDSQKPVSSVTSAETVVFLSWFHAGGIHGREWLFRLIKSHPEKRYILVGVGLTPMPKDEPSQLEVDGMLDASFPRSEFPHLERFYIEGGFDPNGLCLFDRLAMRLFASALKKRAKTDVGAADRLNKIKSGFDGTSRSYLIPVIRAIKAG